MTSDSKKKKVSLSERTERKEFYLHMSVHWNALCNALCTLDNQDCSHI
jgi:hypothetical protein